MESSHLLLERARATIAGVTFSMMKRPEQFCPGSFPVYLERGDGAVVVDVDGNAYVDFICGLGANSLGHGHPAVTGALRDTVERGLLHSLPTDLEVRVAESVLAATGLFSAGSFSSGARLVRLFKTGADATSAAVRLARHATGRERIITVGYNGWHDHFQYDTPGVPAAVAGLTSRLPLFQVEQEAALLDVLKTTGSSLAAVVLSLPYNRIPSREFLQELRATCSAVGALLVLDEIVTGFRLALGGAREYFGIDADLTCYSKALAAGMPLSALVGAQGLMDKMNDLQVSTTFGGELLSLAVCEAVLRVYQETDYFSHIARLGRLLRSEVNRVSNEHGASLQVCGYDPIPLFSFSSNPAEHVPRMTQFVGLMAQRGFILRRDVNFLCAAHTEAQIRCFVEATADALSVMKS